MKSSPNVKQSPTSSSERASVEIRLSPERIVRFLGWVVVGLAAAHFLGQFSKHVLGYGSLKGMIPLFDLDLEFNIPSLYSGLSLIGCAMLLGAIALLKKQKRDRYLRHWQGLSLIFLLMGVDEIIELHERTIKPLRNALNATGIFYFTWVILGFALVVLLAIAYRKFTLSLPPKTRNRFILAASLFLLGTLGIELIGGYYAYIYGKENLIYSLWVALEEGLEMAGILVFISALLTYLRSLSDSITIHFERSLSAPTNN
ncbi:hypothetical protein QQ054_01410 [Oscillatoria amoena NRMC-F 0135]|nr:hypothetical protein [Geitlerinema splendidum]MDL5044706.1 hypothetical protein [Oscillatoria amoena NRMC-F 0135]